MAGISGLRGSGEFTTDYRPTNYRELYTLLEPNGDAPMQALLAMTNGESTDDPKYTNFRDEMPARTVQIDNGAGYNSSATTLQLDTGSDVDYMVANTLIVNASTGEVMRLTTDAATTGSDQIVVQRNVGGTSLSITDNDVLFVAGFAAQEGVDTPTPVSFDPGLAFNYTQIFRTAFSVTNTLANTYLRTGDKEDEYADKALRMHMSDIERNMFFGRRSEDTSTASQPRRTTGGLINTLTNVIDVGVQTTGINATQNKLTEAEFDKYLIETVFAYGSKEKLAFVGPTIASHLQQIGKARWQPTQVSGSYGVNFTRYQTFAGDLLVHMHPQFRQLTHMKDSAVIIDFPFVKYRYLQNRDTQLLRDRQGNGEDRVKHEFLTECGLELTQDKVHAYIKNWAAIV